MSELTENFDARERNGDNFAPLVLDAAIIFCGSIVAINTSTAEAQPAADAASLMVVGRAEEYVDNTDDGERVNYKSGIFRWNNSSANPVVNGAKYAYIEDDNTISSDAGTYGIIVPVIEVDSDGVWVDTTRPAVLAAIAYNVPPFDEAALVADPNAMDDLTYVDPDAITYSDPDAITYSDPDAITYSDPDAITAENPSWGDTTSVDQAANLGTFGAAVVTDLGAIRTALVALGADVPAVRTALVALGADVPAVRTALVALGADVPAVRTKLLAAGADLAAAKTAVDANNTAIDATIDALQGGGLMATE